MNDLNRDYPGCAERAGLRYVDEHEAGLHRVRHGKGFSYLRPGGARVTVQDRARCVSLAIPPAWGEVWICAHADGHIQATGRDARQRKQYRYHPEWNELRQRLKYDRLPAFGDALPTIRARVEADLSLRGLSEDKVLATVIALMSRTLIRVGNAEYARDNESFGLTTLRGDHVEVEGVVVRFSFRGKSGKHREVDLHGRRLARIVRQCQELQGQELFTWRDASGALRDVRSDEVNHYIRTVSGYDFTAKDFRTWAGSVRCFHILRAAGPPDSAASRKRQLSACFREVAAHLGNTPTVCRAYYVHPRVVTAWTDGHLFEVDVPAEPQHGLGRSEHGLLRLLRDHAT